MRSGRRPSLSLRAGALALALALAPAAPAAAQSPVAGEVAERIERLRAAGRLEVAGARVAASPALLGAYEAAGLTPLWSAAARADLRRALAEVAADGLDPDHYFRAALDAVAAAPAGAARDADLDLLHTAALVAIGRDLRLGRARPREGVAGFETPVREMDAAAVARAAASGEVRAELARMRPTHFVYRGLVAALARLRETDAAGGWEPLPAARSLRPDSTDARVPALRRRLAAEGYPVPGDPASLRYDAALARAVRSFQHHHGLNEDAIVGPATLAELNVPVGERIAQVRVNLERARWITPGLPDTFVVVNIAGAKVYLVRDGEVALESRVVVGKDFTRTPVFRATLRSLDLNPTWTVPRSINDEVLASIRKDPGYMARVAMRVLDAGGREIHPSRAELLRHTGDGFPWTFRQDGGPQNPLGGIKFVLPNPHSVYLHDTPSRSLFEREERLFSHGCIRVQNPLALAELVLGEPARWSRESLAAAIATGDFRNVPLARPLAVVVQYWTASSDEHGELHFYRDVYGRDAALLAQLDSLR